MVFDMRSLNWPCTTHSPWCENTTRFGTDPITVPGSIPAPFGAASTTRRTGGRPAGNTSTSTKWAMALAFRGVCAAGACLTTTISSTTAATTPANTYGVKRGNFGNFGMAGNVKGFFGCAAGGVFGAGFGVGGLAVGSGLVGSGLVGAGLGGAVTRGAEDTGKGGTISAPFAVFCKIR